MDLQTALELCLGVAKEARFGSEEDGWGDVEGGGVCVCGWAGVYICMYVCKCVYGCVWVSIGVMGVCRRRPR